MDARVAVDAGPTGGADAGQIGTGSYSGVRHISGGRALGPAFGIALDGAGALWVADPANRRVVKLGDGGSILVVIDGSAAGATAFIAPLGLAVDRGTGDLWVSDPAANVVQSFSPAGALRAKVSAGLDRPYGIAADAAGAVYVADTGHDVIKKLDRAGAQLAELGAGALESPYGVAVDGAGNLWVSDTGHDAVKQLGPTGSVLATLGGVSRPVGLVSDGAGGVWVADSGGARVLRLSATGQVLATIDGGGTGDRRLLAPQAVALAGTGELWVSDPGNELLHRYAGDGALLQLVDRRPGTLASPRALSVDATGVWVADTGHDLVARFGADGSLAGAVGGTAADPFFGPWGFARAADGSLWIADTGADKVRKVDANGAMLLVLDDFSEPSSVVLDGSGNLWVADSGNHQVRKIAPDGTPLAMLDGRGAGAIAFNTPREVAIDSRTGNVWVANTGANVVESFAPDGRWLSTLDGSVVGATPFSAPAGVTVDGAGNVWVADTGNGLVQKFSAAGVWLDALDGNEEGATPFSVPGAVAVDAAGQVYVADTGGNRIQVLAPRPTKPVARLRPQGVAVPPEMSFTGTASYTAQQYNPFRPELGFITYRGSVAWTIVYEYLANFGVYSSLAGRSKITGTRSLQVDGSNLCSGPTMLNPSALGGMRVLIFGLTEARTRARIDGWPWRVVTGCDNSTSGIIQSPFNPPVGGEVPGFPGAFEANFPSHLLTRPGSKLLGKMTFSGNGWSLRPVGGGEFRVDLINWTVSSSLEGVAPGAYVSIGDSFSAATGAPVAGATPYDPGSGDCFRSQQSYGAIYDQRNPKNTIFIPCSGAQATDLENGLGGEPPQLDRIPLSAGKVSVTIGGNDAGLFGVLRTCVFYGLLPLSCEQMTPAGLTNAMSVGPAIARVLGKAKAAAPEATVAILEYPNPFRPAAMDCDGLRNPTLPLIGIRGSDAPYLRSLVVAVNQQVSSAASSSGAVFVPTAPAFVGHDVCGDSWFAPLTAGPSSIHPSAAGNVAMKDALISTIGLAD